MNQKSLFATMRNIVMKATGVRNVYFSDQPNHAPSGEYATIRILQATLTKQPSAR